MRGFFKALILMTGIFSFSAAAFGQVKRAPDSAYDTARDRYLMVWEEVDGDGTVIKAQFRNTDGSEGSGSPVLISDPRTTQGCFYGQFDEQNGDITTPSDCSQNLNPSVSYNDGKYLVAWEVHGNAASPSSEPDNQFINIFAQIVDAETLNPLSGWEEGILISKVFIAANNAESRCGDRHACNDSQIQAWSKSKNPDVTPQLGGSGFIVTWQTNKDFIGCADSERRGGWAVYGRYIDQNFSATSTTNPAAFAVFKDDSTVTDSCEPLSNVDNGSNPRIAVNQTSADFVIVYEVARANGGNASIGAKRVTLGSDNVGQVNGSLMPDIVASVSGSSLNNPEVVSFKSQYVLFASDGSDIRTKGFASDSISSSEPAALSFGSGSKINPRAATNLGIGGQRGGGSNSSPERILIAYERAGNIFAATLNEGLEVTRAPQNISSGSSENQFVEIASDVHNFLGVWQGNDSETTVFAEFISSEDGAVPTPSATPNVPPTAPGLTAPANGTTFAPTRAYLSWNASTDTDGGTITYNVYFGEGAIPATPQLTGLTNTNFVIGPETEGDTGITLEASSTYQWKIEADDGQGGKTSSAVRTLNTDNSVMGWWRFDENPAGAVCGGGGAGETICDYSGRNNHGVPNGGPTWLPPPMPGILGGALQTDGTNDFVSVSHDASLSLNNFMTVEAYLEPLSPGASDKSFVNKYGLSNQNAGNYYLANHADTGTLTFEFYHGVMPEPNRRYQAVGTPAIAGGQHLITFRHQFGSGASSEFRVDNVAAAGSWTVGTGNETPVLPTGPLGIGATSIDVGGARFYKGILDEIIIYNKYLTPTELTNGFNSRQ